MHSHYFPQTIGIKPRISHTKTLAGAPALCYNRQVGETKRQIGESYNGSITVSKTVHGGSNPSSPAYLKRAEILCGF